MTIQEQTSAVLRYKRRFSTRVILELPRGVALCMCWPFLSVGRQVGEAALAEDHRQRV
jgi:hypothetical protein